MKDDSASVGVLGAFRFRVRMPWRFVPKRGSKPPTLVFLLSTNFGCLQWRVQTNTSRRTVLCSVGFAFKRNMICSIEIDSCDSNLLDGS